MSHEKRLLVLAIDLIKARDSTDGYTVSKAMDKIMNDIETLILPVGLARSKVDDYPASFVVDMVDGEAVVGDLGGEPCGHTKCRMRVVPDNRMSTSWSHIYEPYIPVWKYHVAVPCFHTGTDAERMGI